MRGDRVDVGCVSAHLIDGVLARIEPLLAARAPVRVGILGESGSGKTVLAHALASAALATGRPAVVIQLDDYFRYPPRDNEARRRADLGWVGPGEVDLARLDGDLQRIADGAPYIDKPLVDFPQNTIGQERLDVTSARLVIVEGTYVGLLHNLDFGVFIDRTYEDTREARRARGREAQSEWLEAVLAIEHRIVRQHLDRVHLVIDRDYRIRADI